MRLNTMRLPKMRMLIIDDINYEKRKENQKENLKIDKLKVKANNIVVGDLVRYKIEKGTFSKGYAITYSNDIHRALECF
jgi:predicted nicotinamide N-methyase